MVLPALREENLAKIEEENDKKIVVLPCQVGERRKVEKLFENDDLKLILHGISGLNASTSANCGWWRKSYKTNTNSEGRSG